MPRRNRPLFSLIMLLSLVISLAHGITPAAAQGDDEEGVAPFRETTRLERSVYGPERGTIVHDDESIAFVHAEVNVHNFYAKARVTAPYDGEEQTWDAGFAFRYGRDLDWRLTVYSTGTWDLRLGAGDPLDSGEIDSLDIAEGDTNDIELVAFGDAGYLAINGEETASFDLSQRGVKGDVLLGAGFTNESTIPGSEMNYSRFQIWELEDEVPVVNVEALGLIALGRDTADAEDPVERISSGELEESEESVPIEALGVDLADVYVRVEITNPRAHDDHPFDIGFGLRDQGENEQYRVVIASDGSWYIGLGAEALFASLNFEGFNDGEGDTNEFEIAIQGDLLALAVNGELVGSVEVAGLDDAGDVFIGTAFYPTEDFVEGGVTEFDDLSAWEIIGDGPIDEETVTPEASEEPEDETVTPVAGDPDEIFENYLDEADSLEIAYGPEEGAMEHEPDALSYVETGVQLENFMLHAEFINPYDAADGSWDFGVLFRLGDDEPHARLIILSNGAWQLSPGVDEAIQAEELDTLNIEEGDSNVLDLIVTGDVGYFGINGEFVAELDLSEFHQGTDILLGTAFFADNFQEGAETGYEDVIIWALDDSAPSADPTEEASPETTVEPTEGLYESPTYGYSVEYGDEWSIDSESSDADVDFIRLTNDVSTVDIYGYEYADSPDDCLDAEFEFYETAEGYSDAEAAVDDNDDELRGEEDDYVWGVYWFTFTPEDGDPTAYTAYVECRPIEDGETMIKVVQFVVFDEYNDEIAPRDELLAGLSLDGASNRAEPTEEATEEATEEPTEEATAETDETPETDSDSIVVLLDSTEGSTSSGIATIEPAGPRSDVIVLAIGAEDGWVLAIQEGSCDDLPGEAAFTLKPVKTGISDTRVRIAYDDLISGDYVITLSESEDDLDQPLACGLIEPL